MAHLLQRFLLFQKPRPDPVHWEPGDQTFFKLKMHDFSRVWSLKIALHVKLLVWSLKDGSF